MSTDKVEFLFITGLPRSGTTLMMDWLKEAIPGEKLWLRESGVPNLAHQILSAFEFERRNHPWGFDLVEDSAKRAEVMARARDLILALYRTYGWREGMRIVDKEPYFAPDGFVFVSHLQELFSQLKTVCMLRNFESTISSMLRRTWGRGPFPRPNRISPFSYQFSNLDNCIADMLPAGADAVTINQAAHWSLRKCCASYGNAVTNIHDLVRSGQRVLVLNYENLAEPEKVRALLGSFIGIELTGVYQFAERSRAKEFDEEERAVVQKELYDRGIMEKYAELQELAAAPFRR